MKLRLLSVFVVVLFGGFVSPLLPSGYCAACGECNWTSNEKWYVDSEDGSDSTGTGSSGNPWATINYAVDHSSVGDCDTIIVQSGTISSPNKYLSDGGISIDKQLRIRSTGGKDKTIWETKSFSSSSPNIISIDADNVIIGGEENHGFTIYRLGTGKQAVIINSDNEEICDVEISHNNFDALDQEGQSGMSSTDKTPNGITGCIISDNTFTENNDNSGFPMIGIDEGEYICEVEIKNNKFKYNCGDVYAVNAIKLGGNNSNNEIIVSDNKFLKNSSDDGDFENGIFIDGGSRGIHIFDNTFEADSVEDFNINVDGRTINKNIYRNNFERGTEVEGSVPYKDFKISDPSAAHSFNVFLNNIRNGVEIVNCDDDDDAGTWEKEVCYTYNGVTYDSTPLKSLGNYYYDYSPSCDDTDGDGICDTSTSTSLTCNSNGPKTVPALKKAYHRYALDIDCDGSCENDSDCDGYSDDEENEFGSDPNDATSFPRNLLIDYGSHGLYEYDGVNNVQLGSWNPEGLDFWYDEDKVVMDYGTHGPHTYDGSTWTDLGTWDAEEIEPWGSLLAIDYGTKGLYTYDSLPMTQAGTWDPEGLEAWGSLLAIDYGTKGLYTYDGTNFNSIHSWDPENLEAYGDELIADFGTSHGLYAYEDTTWTELDSEDPEGLEAWNGLMAIDLGTEGLYTYDGTTFEQVRAWELEGFKAWGDKLVIDYGTAHGVWFYDGTSFSDPSTGGDWDPISFGPFGAKLAVDFGTNTGTESNGIYIYNSNGGTWEHLGTWSPETDGDPFLEIPYKF